MGLREAPVSSSHVSSLTNSAALPPFPMPLLPPDPPLRLSPPSPPQGLLRGAKDIDWATILPIILPILAAAIGYLVNLVFSFFEDRRLLRLEQVNKSLQSLYGPLYALNCVDDSVVSAAGAVEGC